MTEKIRKKSKEEYKQHYQKYKLSNGFKPIEDCNFWEIKIKVDNGLIQIEGDLQLKEIKVKSFFGLSIYNGLFNNLGDLIIEFIKKRDMMIAENLHGIMLDLSTTQTKEFLSNYFLKNLTEPGTQKLKKSEYQKN